jgi:hypothetical protein
MSRRDGILAEFLIPRSGRVAQLAEHLTLKNFQGSIPSFTTFNLNSLDSTE